MQQFSLPIPNHIKLDVDGTEYQILQGAMATLGCRELCSVLLEVNEEHESIDQVVGLLEQGGLAFHSQRVESSLWALL